MKKGIYVGIQPESYANFTKVAFREFSHIGKNAGREVKYYHTWRVDEEHEEIKPMFEDDELNKGLIKNLDKIFKK